jgi:LacI family transcriptional regulator
MPKGATIKAVAERAGVSVATVSRVLNKRANVSPEARERVQAAIAALDFRPNQQARGMRARSNLIGIMMGLRAPEYVVQVQLGAAERCREEGRRLVLGSFDPERQSAAAAIAQMIASVRLDGLLLFPPLADDPEVLETVRATSTPCARLSVFEAEGLPTVRIDERQAAADMTRHLLALGHRRIGFIKGHPRHGASPLRFAGFCEALEESGVAPAPELIVEGDFSFESGLVCGTELLKRSKPPTAIFAANDEMAIGVIAAAKALDVRVPADLSVAGFDDVQMASSVWPPLTTVRQPMREMAEVAVDMLFQMIGREGVVPEHRVLETAIVIRGSTAAPSKRA